MSPSLPSGNLARASLASRPKRTCRIPLIPAMSLDVAMADTNELLRTRSGWRSAMRWAITPPSEAPKMCACSQPSASSTATASSVMSSEE